MSARERIKRPEIQLRVADARQRDVGRGIARINRRAMRALGISPGDIIEIEGTKRTAAIAWPAYEDDQDDDIIRIDGIIRENAGVSLGDYVIVRKADVRNATSVTIAPTDVRFREVDRETEDLLRNRLVNRPVVEGDIVRVRYVYRPLTFTIVRTRPKGVVRITYRTRLISMKSFQSATHLSRSRTSCMVNLCLRGGGMESCLRRSSASRSYSLLYTAIPRQNADARVHNRSRNVYPDGLWRSCRCSGLCGERCNQANNDWRRHWPPDAEKHPAQNDGEHQTQQCNCN